MSHYTAAAQFYRSVRDFAQRQPDWAPCVIYDTKPDEAFDATLISQRVYGTRAESMAVLAALGLDSVEQEILQQRVKLPTADQLRVMKGRAGFFADTEERPTAVARNPLGSR